MCGIAGIASTDGKPIPRLASSLAVLDRLLAHRGPDGNGAWIAVDPTFNQVPADATHIKLVEGDLDKMLDLMQVMGKLQVKVEDAK
jgi:asparagine synthetase B (glutamine-hydrolysing)